MITTVFTFHCDTAGCKEEFTSEDATSKRILKLRARKNGWLIRGAKLHQCPTHRPVREKKVKAPKKAASTSASKKGSKAPAGGNPARKTPLTASKKPNGAAVFSGGQSIGKMAKTAKVAAAPAAE